MSKMEMNTRTEEDVMLEQGTEESASEKVQKFTRNLQEETEKRINEDVEYLKGIESVEELQKLEDERVELCNEFDNSLHEYDYNVTEFQSTTFDGVTYTYETIAQDILSILEGISTSWNKTLAYYSIMMFWKLEGDKRKTTKLIPHHLYDSTLNLLAGREYQGLDNMRRILLANQMFSETNLHQQYIENMAKQQLNASLHQNVMNRIAEIETLNNPITQEVNE